MVFAFGAIMAVLLSCSFWHSH